MLASVFQVHLFFIYLVEIIASSLIVLFNYYLEEKVLDAWFVPQHCAKHHQSRDETHIPYFYVADMVVVGHKVDYPCK